MPISRYLPTEHFIQISRGHVLKTSHINKFGYNPAVGTTFETVHDASGTYTYPSTAGVATVAGASDTGAVIEIQGLDENFNQVIEDVTVGSSSTTTFIRVFRARVKTLTSGTVNAGNITVTVDGAVRATILAGNGQTLMAVYTVPANKTAYLLKFQGSIEKQKECEFKIMAREFESGVFNAKAMFGAFGSTIEYEYPVPLVFKAKTDIEVLCKAGATTAMGAIFDLILIDK